MMPVNTFLRSTFFPGTLTFVTEEVMLDYKKGKRKMAPFVAPRVGGITMDRQGYRTDKYAAPKIAPQREISVDDLVIRGMGENIFSQRTPADRQAELLGRDMVELDDMITRREEWMAAQLLFNGKITMKGYIDRNNSNYIEQDLDYGFTNKVILAGDNVWTGASAQIYANLKAWRLAAIQASGKAPTICVLGQSAADAFMNDADIQKKMNMYHVLLADINPKIVSDAVTYIGRLPELGLDIYTYNDWYLDEDGNEYPFVPVDHVLLGRPGMGEVLYGAVTQMENDQFVTIEGSRVPKSWSDNQNEQRMIRLTSRPVPKPESVDDWYVAHVI
ncbi:hypothetical protein Dred_1207 [Desulforamulus reducens MI-1]|uniref:Phage major capsid protein E n=2 Tax=Desulforamulus TaxID=2916693 RepID=A4J3T8_DESRM|nr:hypothetical protein Dred_1207 [Desulforamulus reducens MI-1]